MGDCDMGCQPDWHRDDCAIYDPVTPEVGPVTGAVPGLAEVDRVTRLLMAEWERVEEKPVSASFVATFADMGRVVIADRDRWLTTALAQPDVVEAMARESAQHVVYYSTRYDGKGGVKWADDGGLHCNCNWTAPPEPSGLRPWPAWHAHVQAAALAAALPEALTQTAAPEETD